MDNSISLIQKKIFEFRNHKTMMARDLAEMYGIETRVLMQAVKRNIERFPEDFMFQLTSDEFNDWKSQIVISNSIKMGMRHRPYVFTELGVAMLSSVLNSKAAIQINIGIMRAFVFMRNTLATNSGSRERILRLEKDFAELKSDLEEIFTDYNDINEDTRMQLEIINESLAELQSKNNLRRNSRPRIGFLH